MNRILGIIGGTGPESTIDYYRSIVSGYRTHRIDGAYPRLLINSVEASAVMQAIAHGELESVARTLLGAVEQLAAAGAGAALFASNTVHLAFNAVAADSPIPLLSIVDATAGAAKARNVSSVGLLGLRLLVEAPLYPARLAREGIRVVRPSSAEQEYIDATYLDELVNGIFRNETRDELSRIIGAIRAREEIDAVILGGTELSLLLTGPSTAGVPLLHSAQIHVETALNWLLTTEGSVPTPSGEAPHVTSPDAD